MYALTDCGIGSDDDRRTLDALSDQLRQDRFRVLVTGEAKRGKSTLPNALLGRDVLPTGVTPVTALATTTRPALEWTMSRLVVEPVTEPIARHAAALLADAGLHGHKYAIDAMLSAAALAAPGPVTILTSDPENLTALCRGQATVVKV